MKQLTGGTISISSVSTFTNTNIAAAPATHQIAYGFIATEATIQSFWVRVGNVGGTDANRKITFELQADSTGKPSDTALATYEQVGGFTANTQLNIAPSWSVSLTVGARYWIVCKNTSVEPTTDYIGLAHTTLLTPLQTTTYNAVTAPFIRRQFNGTDWTTTILDHATTLTLEFASGTLHGVSGVATIGYNTAWLIGATIACGTEFRVPSGSAPLNIVAVGLYILNPPTTKLYAYRNRSLVASSPYPTESITNSRLVTLPLEFTAYPGDWIAIMTDAIASSSGQVGGVTYTGNEKLLKMKQWGNRIVKLDNGTTWTTDETQCPNVVIYLHPDTPFAPAPLNRRKYNNQR